MSRRLQVDDARLAVARQAIARRALSREDYLMLCEMVLSDTGLRLTAAAAAGRTP